MNFTVHVFTCVYRDTQHILKCVFAACGFFRRGNKVERSRERKPEEGRKK